MDAGDSHNITQTSPINNTSPIFAVYYPDDMKNSPRVFYQSVKEATKFANSPEGRSRGARFRRFGNSSEATNFFESGDCQVPLLKADSNSAASDPVVAFSSVSRIDMNKLKKVIETDSLTEFLVLADVNPRYLINTSGDTAAIVQEGFRFNSLHIAAQNGSALIADHILLLISDTEYLIKLYGTNEVDANLRKENILISYLNTPDKGNGDTPLHIAAKWGHVEVARIIASYHQSIRSLKNKNGETPLDVLCSRYSGDNKEELSRQLRIVLDSYYVALYRSCDHSAPSRFVVSSFYPLKSFTPSIIPPLDFPLSPILSSFVLTAVVGPFDSEKNAMKFEKKWKGQGLDGRRKDFERGAEKVGREMASEVGVQWAESWPFHSEPIDIKSNYGLEVMEKHLKSIVYGDEKNEEKEVDREEDYEDAREEWTNEGSNSELLSWTEEDSLGSLYTKMQSLNMNDANESDNSEEAMEENKEEELDWSLEGFATPPSSPPPLFLNELPTKLDNDLYEVISSVADSELCHYPLIRRFISSMNGLDRSMKLSLPSLTSPRYWGNSGRSRLIKRSDVIHDEQSPKICSPNDFVASTPPRRPHHFPIVRRGPLYGQL
ncbi:hypothetical protein PFISCL1PPCAC_15456 [Pristionchus fissidentatus]|uniref:ANKLE2 third alpha/beta domain-containing protein n=1 Tax=Pristionchus fissidentatus TaxID=1538716 RepID=A0AAV5W2L1_9BILA|nr:hypothetical protein PFISCL1PPCAC_15456 [Pristionchus fissidentatus]